MERKVTKLEHSHVEVLVTVDETSWKAAQDKAFKKLAANVTVDGFRKGKAPANLVKARVDQVKVMDEAINGLLPTIYQDIIEKDGIHPYAQPKVDVTKLSDTELEVKFVIVTAPEVKLGAYKDLAIGKTEPSVSEEEVKKSIDALLKNNANLVIKEGEAANGDIVVMDFVGTINGEKFDGGSAENHELELGSGQFIPGFEEQLVGHRAGEHVVVKVTFPTQYVPELAGKDAEFACDIHEVKEKKLPELNDEFVKEQHIANVETVEQLNEFKKAEILNNKTAQAHREYINKVIDTIAKDSTVDIPDEILDSQVESRKQDLEQRMSQSGLTLEQYLTYIGQKEEDFLANLKKEALKDVTGYVIMEEVGKLENLEVTEADLEFEMSKIADQYKMTIDDVKKALANSLGEFKNQIKMQRIEDFLFNNNK